MRIVSTALLPVLLLGLAGCASTAEAEPDEGSFIAAMNDLGYDGLDPAEQIKEGYRQCDAARDAGESVLDHTQGIAALMPNADAATWSLAVAVAAGKHLCPDLAG